MKFIDLFSGIGGFRTGMEMNGHECVAFCEIDKYARQSYKAIHNTEGEDEWHDITQVTDGHIRQLIRDRGHIDCICGGFPCQSFSIAGKRGGFEDTRGTLFFEIMRIASIIRPRYLFLENVKGLFSHDGGATFETILNTLDEAGYDAEWSLLNSKHFGVPQNRERVFIIGHLRGAGGRTVFPVREGIQEPSNEMNVVGHTRPSKVQDRTRIFDTKGIGPALRATDYKDPTKIVRPVLTPDRLEKRQNGRRFKENGEPMFTLTAQDRHGIMMTRKELTCLTDISHCLMARDYKGIGNQEMAAVLEIKEETKKGYTVEEVRATVLQNSNMQGRRIKEDGEPSFTVGASDRHGVTIGGEQGFRIRKLTPLECFRLQGFTDEQFYKAKNDGVSDSQLYKQAGNSVTVNVIDAIAKKLGESP